MCFGMRCRSQRADVMIPSQPSFCTPGSPPRNLSVTSLPSPALRNLRPSMSMRAVRSTRARSGARARPSRRSRNSATSTSWILPRLCADARHLEPVASGSTMRHQTRLSTAVPHKHGFLAAGVHRDVAADARGVGGRRIDGEYIACAFCGVGNTPRHHAGLAEDRRRGSRRHPAASVVSTELSASSFSVLITAASGVSGMAPPV